jgi:FAD/FMN-containing dehydrogenase
MFSLERTFGWSNASHAESYVSRAGSPEDVDRILKEASHRGLSVTLRGAGYSYGDEILNSGGAILDLSGMDRILDWNPENGQMRVEPGVRFEQALNCCLKDNWVLPVVPGTRYLSIGGALSNNVHGKNGWSDGNFGACVVEFTLLTARGDEHRCSREKNSELFHAVIGGMGMFGVVLEIDLQLKRIPSPFLKVRKWTVSSLERMLDDFGTLRGTADYHIGWVDCFTKGANFGRGTIHAASFVEAPRSAKSGREFSYTSPYFFGFFPRTWIWPVIKPFFGNPMMKMVNSAKYHLDRMASGGEAGIQTFFEFTFLLDTIPGWKSLFEPHGYLELEPLLPFANCVEAFRELILLTQAYGHPSHLTAIKSHRKDEFMLGFSLDGCSIGIDIPVDPGRRKELIDLFGRMNDVVSWAGGKTYLAKDEMLSADHFRLMYPNWRAFDDLKKKYDSDFLFCSDMYRRLFA